MKETDMLARKDGYEKYVCVYVCACDMYVLRACELCMYEFMCLSEFLCM